MKEIKPIRTEKDYEAALVEAEKLWGAKLGTPEGDRLDVLATLIDGYEAKKKKTSLRPTTVRRQKAMRKGA